MATQADKLVSEIRALPDEDKLRVLDAILTDLNKPDPEIDQVWAEEARKRWNSYKAVSENQIPHTRSTRRR